MYALVRRCLEERQRQREIEDVQQDSRLFIDKLLDDRRPQEEVRVFLDYIDLPCRNLRVVMLVVFHPVAVIKTHWKLNLSLKYLSESAHRPKMFRSRAAEHDGTIMSTVMPDMILHVLIIDNSRAREHTALLCG